MKNLFPEYYKPTVQEYDKIWNEALIVFDTNTLLDLYRYSEESSSDFISVMKFYKARLWLPYQIAWEFQRNRISTICGHIEAYHQLCAKLDDEFEKAFKAIRDWEKALYKRHPYIKLESIEKAINKSKDAAKKKLEKQKTEYPFQVDDDSIFNELTNLYKDKVGENYDDLKYHDLFSEAKKRYEKKIPPGYCDESDKKGEPEQQLYGDVILWKQIIDKSKNDKKDIIFVSNDEKEDWRLRYHGKNIDARKELIKEFVDTTGQKILIYNSQRFLEYAKKNKELKVSAKTIKEIETVKNDNISWFAETTFPTLYPYTLFGEQIAPATTLPKYRQLGLWQDADEFVGSGDDALNYYNPLRINQMKAAQKYVGIKDLFENPRMYVDVFEGLKDVSGKILELQSKKEAK